MIGLMLIFNNLIDNHILNIIMVLIAYDIVKKNFFCFRKGTPKILEKLRFQRIFSEN